ncbi:unnamed protein product [Heligmosomoides polygyrus]|uniref:DUF1381 domain-containing protein n=1 Tax=Heligmosomoides polygyrus TaxID=6339 RepID=A0A183GS93_HELPZ|nr:unnamed protein product [Heligmosomoides polygyrus]
MHKLYLIDVTPEKVVQIFQEAEEFASFESVHEARMREAETQTSENTVHCVEKGVQTGSAGEEQSPEEIQAARFDQHRQSEC